IEYEDGIKATRIKILNENGAAKMEKPVGNYITIEAEGILEEKEGIKEKAERAVAEELKSLINFDYYLKVLVAGLGNSMVTPDALGPETAAKIRVTRHLFVMFEADGDDEMSNVSCIIPGVTATTGLETADIIKKAAELSTPDIVIAIDSLAARNIERVSTTIQITDTGIAPGGGMGNNRKGINESTVGTRVIAIGVPTVIDATTIIRDALDDNIESAEKVEKYIQEYDRQMIVTSTDIDMIIKDFSDIIANGINKTIHPGIYS
ncbi:MAG: GPR endopeptidase, partial [Anaerovoracaceae bacterium]